MGTHRILVVGEHADERRLLEEALAGHVVESRASADDAMTAIAQHAYDALFVSRSSTDESLESWVARVRDLHAALPIVVIDDADAAPTGRGVALVAVLARPVGPTQVHAAVEAVRHALRSGHEVAFLRDYAFESRDVLVGDSPAAHALERAIAEAATHRRPVLLHGEPGTGKRTAALRLHRTSARAAQPFVVVDCGASPEGMLTRELFGGPGRHCGETAGRVGLADGGTLLLDRVDLMPLGCQARLAALLADGAYERGDGVRTAVDVRIVATTVRDLHRAAESGAVRRDVLERLGTTVIGLAPLAERVEDIPFLVEHFIDALGPRSTVRAFGPEAMERLSAYEWPGNVRELEILVQRLGVLDFGEEIMPEHLPPEISGQHGSGDPYSALVGMSIHDIEREMILKTLDETGHNKTAAAKVLGLTARTLHNKLRLYREQGIIAQDDYRPLRRDVGHPHGARPTETHSERV